MQCPGIGTVHAGATLCERGQGSWNVVGPRTDTDVVLHFLFSFSFFFFFFLLGGGGGEYGAECPTSLCLIFSVTTYEN